MYSVRKSGEICFPSQGLAPRRRAAAHIPPAAQTTFDSSPSPRQELRSCCRRSWMVGFESQSPARLCTRHSTCAESYLLNRSTVDSHPVRAITVGHVGAKRCRDRESACWTLPGQSRSAVRLGARRHAALRRGRRITNRGIQTSRNTVGKETLKTALPSIASRSPGSERLRPFVRGLKQVR